jgi:hypothetical protein
MLDMALSSIGGRGVVHLNHATVGRAIQVSKDLWVITTLMYQRNRELAGIFDDQRRSTALEQLAHMWALDLLTADEMARFSLDTCAGVRFLTGR